jgi:hypothetical protein
VSDNTTTGNTSGGTSDGSHHTRLPWLLDTCRGVGHRGRSMLLRVRSGRSLSALLVRRSGGGGGSCGRSR